MSVFGAIQFGAWYGEDSSVGSTRETRRVIGCSLARPRAPLHADISRPQVVWRYSVATMEAEIAAAVGGGLAYWAFLRYANRSSELNRGFTLYDQAANKAALKYCWMIYPDYLGSTGNYTTEVAEVVSRMLESNYQKVGASRPVLYITYDASLVASNWGGSNANFKVALDALRGSAQTAGLGNPYIILCPFSSGDPVALMPALGCDALSNYAVPTKRVSYQDTFANLRTDVEAYWATMAGVASQVVPILHSGWDNGPQHERNTALNAFPSQIGKGVGFARPTASEFAAHCQSAKDWMTAHPSACPYGLALVYSWNEFLEGGWLAPTYGDPTGILLSQTAAIIGS